MVSKEIAAHFIANTAVKAMLYEVSCTPKPGLVDRLNSGAHKDMNFFTFINSSLILEKYFQEMTLTSFQVNDDQIFAGLRSIGKRAEEAMFKATLGVNTQKGLIFSLGILCGAGGYLLKKGESLTPPSLCKTAAEIMKQHLWIEDLENHQTLTHGSEVYKKYGFTGARGEAFKGFPTGLNIGLPALREALKYEDYNWAMVHALLSMLAVIHDTNVLYRVGIKKWGIFRKTVKEILVSGSIFTTKGKERVYVLDQEFIKANISPGGSADLLTVTLFLEFLSE